MATHSTTQFELVTVGIRLRVRLLRTFFSSRVALAIHIGRASRGRGLRRRWRICGEVGKREPVNCKGC